MDWGQSIVPVFRWLAQTITVAPFLLEKSIFLLVFTDLVHGDQMVAVSRPRNSWIHAWLWRPDSSSLASMLQCLFRGLFVLAYVFENVF